MPAAIFCTNDPVRHRLLQGCGALVVLLLLAGCEKKKTAPETGVLAKGEGWTVRAEDFRHWWATRPGPADSPQARKEALDHLVERAMLAQAARKAGLENDPEAAAQIEAILIARLQEVHLAPQLEAVKASDEEVRARYDALRESAYTRPDGVHVALLWFNTRGQQPLVDRYRPRLEQIRNEVSTAPAKFPVAAGFGPLAVGNTEHRPSRLIGGDLGWMDLTPGDDPWRKMVLELVAPLKNPGDLSDIVAGKDGLFLVRLIERRTAAVKPFESVSAEIRKSLVEVRCKQLEEEFTRGILSQAPSERFPETLSALTDLPARAGVPPLPGTPSVPPAQPSTPLPKPNDR